MAKTARGDNRGLARDLVLLAVLVLGGHAADGAVLTLDKAGARALKHKLDAQVPGTLGHALGHRGRRAMRRAPASAAATAAARPLRPAATTTTSVSNCFMRILLYRALGRARVSCELHAYRQPYFRSRTGSKPCAGAPMFAHSDHGLCADEPCVWATLSSAWSGRHTHKGGGVPYGTRP